MAKTEAEAGAARPEGEGGPPAAPVTRGQRSKRLIALAVVAPIAPRGSSAICSSSAAVSSPGRLHKLGAIHTAICVLIHLVVGTPSLWLVAR
jgi:hypothetical protein